MDISKLKAAAEGATLHSEEIGEYEWYKSEELTLATGNVINPLDENFITAADPSTVLELIAKVESLEARIRELTQGEPKRWLVEWVERFGEHQSLVFETAAEAEGFIKFQGCGEITLLYTRPAAQVANTDIGG